MKTRLVDASMNMMTLCYLEKDILAQNFPTRRMKSLGT
jgi:hypothetical protein